MNINTDINVLGSILDLNIVSTLIDIDGKYVSEKIGDGTVTRIKTTKSLKRYESAIRNTLVFFKHDEIKDLFVSIFLSKGLSEDCLIILFWNASYNNDLLDYFNQNIYFPALFSGRISIKKDEIIACINEIKQTEEAVKKWSDSTLDVIASKYLSFLSKFDLLHGGRNKTINHKYIDDKQLIIFIYWLLIIEGKPNLLESKWLDYCFLEKETFQKRVLQKKFMKYLNVTYTGDSMKIETLISYKEIYSELTKS